MTHPPADAAASAAAAAQAAATAATAADSTAADTGAASGPPAKYELTLPQGSTLDPAIVERTAATARALGLSNEAGQKLLDALATEATTVATATAKTAAEKALADRDTQLRAEWEPGKGAAWLKRDTEWRESALKDAEVGGSPEKLTATVELAQKVLKQFFPPETLDFLQTYGLGSHPGVLKGLAKIGRSMAEGSLVLPGAPAAAPKDAAELLFPNTFAKQPAAAAKP